MVYEHTLQVHAQAFRAVHKSYKPSTITCVDPDDIIYIGCHTDPYTHINFILWSDIEHAFGEALFVRSRTILLPYLKGSDYRPLEPKRIAAVPDMVLDVVTGGELVALTKVAYPNKAQAQASQPNFLHIDYTLKVPLPTSPRITSSGSFQKEQSGSSAQKVETPPPPSLEPHGQSVALLPPSPTLTNDIVKTSNPSPRGPQEVGKKQSSSGPKRRPEGPQDHAAVVMATKDWNNQMFQPASRFLF